MIKFNDTPSFEIQNSTLLLAEVPPSSNAYIIRAKRDLELQRQYEFSSSSLTQFHAITTDGAAVMVRVAGSSASQNISKLDQNG